MRDAWMPSTLSEFLAYRASGTANSTEAESSTGSPLTSSEGTEGLGYDPFMERLAHPGWCENLVAAGGLKPGEHVLVVVDEPLAEQGAQLAACVKDAGGDPRLELW